MMFEYFIGRKLQWEFGASGMWNTYTEQKRDEKTEQERIIRGKV